MNPEMALEAHHLTKRYGPFTAVDGLSLDIRRGEVFGLLGPNGAGKTTSIQMLCGLLSPDAGWVQLNGVPIQRRAARTQVGVCPQQVVVWEKLTCLEQLIFIGRVYGLQAAEARRRGLKLLDDLGLAEKRDQLAGRLSGGMQRRLNLALALVHAPEIVILDEPEAGLDPQSRVRVREYIQSLARRKTVILTTHNMDEAERLVDRVAIIDHGRLLALDTPQALKQRLGKGDVLELRLEEPGQTRPLDPVAVSAALRPLQPDLQMAQTGDLLCLRGLGLVSLLPRLLAALDGLGLCPSETRLRTNTLEDVFIQLTGRSLRE